MSKIKQSFPSWSLPSRQSMSGDGTSRCRGPWWQGTQKGGWLNTGRVWGLVPAEADVAGEAGASRCGTDQQVSGLEPESSGQSEDHVVGSEPCKDHSGVGSYFILRCKLLESIWVWME